MGETLKRYLEVKARLCEWRVLHPDDTPEEDLLLDEMDVVWEQLSREDHEWINARDGFTDKRS